MDKKIRYTLPGIPHVPNVSRGSILLARDQPFFGSLLMRHAKLEDANETTIRTDGNAVFFNPEWTESLTAAEITGVMANTAARMAFLHPLRMGSRDKQLWTMASHLAVNQILLANGLKLPQGYINDDRFAGMSAEKIYDVLKDDINSGKTQVTFADGSQQGNDGAPDRMKGQGWGDMDPHPAASQGEAERQAAEAEMKMQVMESAQIAKSKGKLPSAFQGLIKEFAEPKVNWRERIRQVIGGTRPDDYSYRRPNRKHMSLYNMYLPTITHTGAGIIAIGVDCSGSVGNEEMTQFLSEIKAIHEETAPELLMIFHCDTMIHHEARFAATDEFDDRRRHGRGGTHLSPVFKRVQEIMDEEGIVPDSFIFLTDLEIHKDEFRGINPDYPVLWVSTSATDAPFGEVLKIKV